MPLYPCESQSEANGRHILDERGGAQPREEPEVDRRASGSEVLAQSPGLDRRFWEAIQSCHCLFTAVFC